MQDENGFVEFDRINCAIGSCPVILNHFKHTSATEPFQHFCRVVLITGLRQGERKTEKPPNLCRQRHQIFVASSDPFERLFVHRKPKLYTNEYTPPPLASPDRPGLAGAGRARLSPGHQAAIDTTGRPAGDAFFDQGRDRIHGDAEEGDDQQAGKDQRHAER